MVCGLLPTLKPTEWTGRGDDPPTEKVSLVAQGTCPKPSFCHTRVHPNHPSLAPLGPCTAFSVKERGRKQGKLLGVSDIKIQRQYMKKMTNVCLTLVVCWKSDYMEETSSHIWDPDENSLQSAMGNRLQHLMKWPEPELLLGRTTSARLTSWF